LSDKTNELANLAKYHELHAIYVAQVRAENRAVQMFTQLGARVPLHCTGVGKAMLANLPSREIAHFFETRELQAYTINTINNPIKLKSELECIRRRGYATDEEEREIGVRCIAAPVFQAGGNVIAAVSVSAPPGRIPSDNDEVTIQLIVETASKLSRRLGYRLEDQGEA
jgi:DNA-binding IclR family transcriptional regulator